MLTATKCRRHEWERLFKAPAEQIPTDSRAWAVFLGLSLDNRFTLVVCRNCGRIGSERRGYSRGGGHAIKPINIDGEQERQYKAEAVAWETTLSEEERLTPPVKTGGFQGRGLL